MDPLGQVVKGRKGLPLQLSGRRAQLRSNLHKRGEIGDGPMSNRLAVVKEGRTESFMNHDHLVKANLKCFQLERKLHRSPPQSAGNIRKF